MSTLPDHHDDVSQSHREPFAMMPESVLDDSRLSDGAKVFYALLDRYWRSDDTAWPSQETLATRLGVSVPVVRRRLRELEAVGRVRTKRRGQGRTNVYVRAEMRRLRIVEPPDRSDSSGLFRPGERDALKETQVLLLHCPADAHKPRVSRCAPQASTTRTGRRSPSSSVRSKTLIEGRGASSPGATRRSARPTSTTRSKRSGARESAASARRAVRSRW